MPGRRLPRQPRDDGFRRRVYALIAGIPRGRVATYGQIARLAGYPRRARHVGMALAHTPQDLALPWHRVITAQGRIARRGGAARGAQQGAGIAAPGPLELRQMRLLRREGVLFRGGRVDLARFGWRPEEQGFEPATAARAARRRSEL